MLYFQIFYIFKMGNIVNVWWWDFLIPDSWELAMNEETENGNSFDVTNMEIFVQLMLFIGWIMNEDVM